MKKKKSKLVLQGKKKKKKKNTHMDRQTDKQTIKNICTFHRRFRYVFS